LGYLKLRSKVGWKLEDIAQKVSSAVTSPLSFGTFLNRFLVVEASVDGKSEKKSMESACDT